MLEIQTLDLHFLGQPSLLASYLVRSEQSEDVALVESGPGSTLEGLTQGLAAHGLAPGDISHLLLTHIHLDHAGAAGWLAEHGAIVYVHERGAPHLLDPSRLWSSATRIYGEEMMHFLWGEMLPIPEEQLVVLVHEDEFEVAGASWKALYTPGHASHHLSYLVDGHCFTGDVAGCAMPESAHIRMPTPPPDLDFELWEQSLQILEAANPQRLYLTHFGTREDPAEHLAQCRRNLELLLGWVEDQWQRGLEKAEIVAAYFPWIEAMARAQGVDSDGLQRFENVVGASGTIGGVLRYLRKRREESTW